MCGRYASSIEPELLVDELDIDEVDPDLPGASYNVAPTDPVPAILERHREAEDGSGAVVRRLRALRWGLVPSWSKDRSGGARMINARAETVAEKPAFRRAFAARRCLLPADGYYEWYDTGRTNAKGKPVKQPFFIHRSDGAPLLMAGLYEFWKDPELAAAPPAEDGTTPDPWWLSCTVITTSATDALGRIHDRMPMVIGAGARDAWLDPTVTDPRQARELLQVTDADLLQAYAVGTAVNSVRNNTPDLTDPLPTDD